MDLFDICEARHRGADTSIAARAKLNVSAGQSAVLAIIRRGECTLDEIAEVLGVAKHSISGRVSELKRAGRIEVCGKAVNAAGNAVRKYREKKCV